MPKTDINKILKKGIKTKVKIIDYSRPAQIKKLKKVKAETELCLKNKDVNWYKMSQIIINK